MLAEPDTGRTMQADHTPTMKETAGSQHLPPDFQDRGTAMAGRADEAAALLRTLSHGGRLLILCHLSSGEKTVRELENLLGLRQAAVSQQLARLRQEGLVQPRRAGKTILYRVADPRAARLVAEVYEIFCKT